MYDPNVRLLSNDGLPIPYNRYGLRQMEVPIHNGGHLLESIDLLVLVGQLLN